jgi:uncharacterized membrane protein
VSESERGFMSRIKEMCFVLILVAIAINVLLAVIKPLLPFVVMGVIALGLYRYFYQRRW